MLPGWHVTWRSIKWGETCFFCSKKKKQASWVSCSPSWCWLFYCQVLFCGFPVCEVCFIFIQGCLGTWWYLWHTLWFSCSFVKGQALASKPYLQLKCICTQPQLVNFVPTASQSFLRKMFLWVPRQRPTSLGPGTFPVAESLRKEEMAEWLSPETSFISKFQDPFYTCYTCCVIFFCFWWAFRESFMIFTSSILSTFPHLQVAKVLTVWHADPQRPAMEQLAIRD